MRCKALPIILMSSTLLSGCLPLFVGGAATAGYISTQERGIKTAILDIETKTHVKERLTSTQYQYLGDVEVNVIHGDVLLTGVVKSPADAVKAEQITRSVDGVKNVYNQLFTDGIYPAEIYSKDTWLATQLRGLFISEKDIVSTNYLISVVNAEAFIMGIARTAGEREQAIHIARTLKGIAQVHNYVKLQQGKSKALIQKEKLFKNVNKKENLFTE